MDVPATPVSRLRHRATRAILDAIGRTPPLYDPFVLKGGLALHLGFGSPRRSHDVDLNAVTPVARQITEETMDRLCSFRHQLNEALDTVRAEYDFESLETQAGTLSKEMPTLMTEVRYRSAGGREGAVQLQVTLSDVVCDTVRRTIRGIPLHLPALEDIIADKLKALLQQAPRDKVRSNDVFDVWYFAEVSPLPVDPAVVTDYLLRKSRHGVKIPAPSKRHFRRKSVVAYSASSYDELAALLPDGIDLPPFRDAYAAVLGFVDRLDLPPG